MATTVLPLHNLPTRGSNISPPDNRAHIPPVSSNNGSTHEDQDDRPWKYIGYRIFSHWTGSEPNFLAIRQFSALHARILLALQDDISVLEEQLDLIDRSYSLPGSEDYDNGSFRRDTCTDRKFLLEKIHLALKKYDKFANGYRSLSNQPAVPTDNIKSIRSWIEGNSGAIADEETGFLNHEDDLISLRPRTRSPLYRLLCRCMYRLGVFPHIIRREPSEKLAANTHTILYNDSKMEIVSHVIIGMVGLSMFIVPFWLLNSIDSTPSKLGLITGFVVFFYLVLALGTMAKPYESLAAAAAYSAVLMVFLQVNSNVGRGA